MKNGKIRLGHVGTFHDHSSAKLKCVLKFPEVFELVGCVAESPEREAEIRDTEPYCNVEFMSREELLARGVDAVLVESFELDLVKEAIFWASHGVHTHIDKPAGGPAEDLEKLYAICDEKKLTAQFAYMYRYNPSYLDCKARIARGELGEIFEVDAVMDTCHSPAKREWLNKLPGGIMYFLGCHMIDLVFDLMGMPDNVTTYLKSTDFDGVHAIDHSFATFEYKKGISTVRATSTEVNGYGRRQLIVCGSLGTYEIEPFEVPTKTFITLMKDQKTYRDCRTELDIPSLDGLSRYDGMMLDFAAMVRGEKENPYAPAYEIALHKLVLYCSGLRDSYK